MVPRLSSVQQVATKLRRRGRLEQPLRKGFQSRLPLAPSTVDVPGAAGSRAPRSCRGIPRGIPPAVLRTHTNAPHIAVNSHLIAVPIGFSFGMLECEVVPAHAAWGQFAYPFVPVRTSSPVWRQVPRCSAFSIVDGEDHAG